MPLGLFSCEVDFFKMFYSSFELFHIIQIGGLFALHGINKNLVTKGKLLKIFFRG